MIDDHPTFRLDRWRLWWLVLFALTALVTSGFLVGRKLHESVPVASPSSAAPVLEETETPTPSLSPSPSPSKTTPAPIPTHGPGKFSYAQAGGPVLGATGTLRRFKVAVEQGSGQDVDEFAQQVAATLGDPRSWIGGGQVRLQMVGGAEKSDFTVFLATRDTAGRMCEQGGTNIRVNGVPYTSCRTTGQAIINLDRWLLSAKPYRNAKVPLATYRQYVINHEVGHELGHHHEGCPKAGGPAPVMVQQTLTTRGCVPYAWPRLGTSFLTGPSM
jgi:hypothetical protein